MPTRPTLLLLAVFAGVFPSAPASAQTGGTERVSQVIVYGTDKCKPADNPDEVVVCARLPESERYRIPEMFRNDPDKPANQSWTERAIALERVGRFGIDSCSPVGMGGFTGCNQLLVRNAYAEKTAKDRLDWAKMTAEARAERLRQLDAESARVEAAVRAEEARRKTDTPAPSPAPK